MPLRNKFRANEEESGDKYYESGNRSNAYPKGNVEYDANSAYNSGRNAHEEPPEEMQVDVMKIARERVRQLRMEAEAQELEDQRLAEQKYYLYKQALEQGSNTGYRDTGSEVPYNKPTGNRNEYRDDEDEEPYPREQEYQNKPAYAASRPRENLPEDYPRSNNKFSEPSRQEPEEYNRRDNRMQSVLSIGYSDNSNNDLSGGRLDSGRLSGRRSEVNYGEEEVFDARALKRQQQQQYRDEIAQAAKAAPIEGERYAKFRSDKEQRDDGINLPGNNRALYGASGYSNPHSHSNIQGNSTSSYANRGQSCGGGKSSFTLG